jgi:hypothetical protein
MGRLNDFYVKVTSRPDGKTVFVRAKFLVVNDAAVKDPNIAKARQAEIYRGPSLSSGALVNTESFLIVPYDFDLRKVIQLGDRLNRIGQDSVKTQYLVMQSVSKSLTHN